MVNITHKSSSLRKAVATAIVQVSSEETILAIQEQRVPKGDVFSFAKVAALFAVKKTSDIIPELIGVNPFSNFKLYCVDTLNNVS